MPVVSDAMLKVMVVVCGLSEHRLQSVWDLADRYGCSSNTLTKAFQKLVRAGVLESKRGPAGGFRLARPLSSLTMMSLYEPLCEKGIPESCQLHRRFASKCPLCRHVRHTDRFLRWTPLDFLKGRRF